MAAADDVPGHSHHHHGWRGTGADLPLARAVWIAVAVCAVLTVVGLVAYWPTGDTPGVDAIGLDTPAARAVVRERTVGPCAEDDPNLQGCQFLDIEVTSGPYDGERGSLFFSTEAGNPSFSDGDKILVYAFTDVNGNVQFSFADFQRGMPMLVLGMVFVVAVLALGRWKGLGALGGLAASLLVLVVFVLPSLLRGNDAVAVALVGSSVIAFIALYLAHGFNVITSVALLGTFASLALIGILAWLFSSATHLTGLTDEYSTVLPALGVDVSIKGILLAGIVIGSLGVLDDVTVTQVSAVAELHHADPTASTFELYRRALRIGRDHIASTVNTLFLAYAGASLPLMLLFTQASQSVGSIATREIVATEIVRSLIGSIGLVASVPITTWMAAKVLTGRPRDGARRRSRVERVDPSTSAGPAS